MSEAVEVIKDSLEDLYATENRLGHMIIFRLTKIVKLASNLKLESSSEFLDELEDIVGDISEDNYEDVFMNLGAMYAYLVSLRADSTTRLTTMIMLGPDGVLFKVSQDMKSDILNLEMFIPEGVKATVF